MGEICWIPKQCGNSDSIITLLDARASGRSNEKMGSALLAKTALAALRLWRTEKRFAESIISGSVAQTDLTF